MKISYVVLAAVALIGLMDQRALAQSAEAQQQIQAAFKLTSGKFSAFEVPSSGAIADTAFIEKSRRSGPSKIARQLADALARGDSTAFAIAVVGPSESKIAQVIRDALVATGKKSLPMLEIIFVGSKATADELQPVVASYGAKFTFAPL